jgi:transcriptional regulator with XRE-family HTH domain
VRKINKIRFYREQKGIGLNKFAEMAEVAPPYLSQLERGLKTNPSKEVMERISKELGKSVPEVFFPEEMIGGENDAQAIS